LDRVDGFAGLDGSGDVREANPASAGMFAEDRAEPGFEGAELS
jgi:hypothetical protein